ncbi:hypothetical protein V6767_13780 [Martelella sp. FLE1502]
MDYFTNDVAKEIWKARWIGIGVQKLVEQHKKSPFRFYEVWSEEKNSGSREEAKTEFVRERPDLAASTDFSPHRRRRKVVPLPPKPDLGQMDLFR